MEPRGNVCPARARRATVVLTIPTSAPDLPSHGEAPQVDHIAGRFLIEKKKKKQERLVTSHFYIVGTVVVISWWPLDGCCSFLVASGWLLLFQPAPCSGQKFSTVRATVRGGPFLVKTLSRALPGDPNHQNMFRHYTTRNPHITTDLSYPSW